MIEKSQYFSAVNENILLVLTKRDRSMVYRIPALDDDRNLLPSKTTKQKTFGSLCHTGCPFSLIKDAC